MILDDIKFSLHQIKNNKGKSIINIVISFMISFLVLFLLFIGISVKLNGTHIAEDAFYSDNNVQIDKLFSQTEEYKKYNDNNYYEIFTELEKFNDVIDDYYVEIKYKQGILYNSYPIYNIKFLSENGKIKLKSSIVDKTDNYVYISDKMATLYSLDKGDSLTIPFSNDGKISCTFSVADIFEDKIGLSSDVIFDYSFFNYKDNDDTINNLFISKHLHIDINKNNDAEYTINKTKIIVDFINGFENQNSQSLAKSDNLEKYNDIMLAVDIFFYVLLVFIMTIIIMSFAIISNSVNILLAENKKSIGLYKVLGMNSKDIFLVLLFEIIFVFGIGILSSIIIEYLLMSFNQVVLNKILNTILLMFDKYTLDLETLSYRLYMPFYIPVILIIVLTILMSFFSYKNIRRIVYDNPILLIKKEE